MLTVQSIEGPGGIGKTYLFDHVRTTNDLSNRNYLTLRIDGSDPSAGWPGLESLWTKPRGFAKRSNP